MADRIDGRELETSYGRHVGVLVFVMLLPTASTWLYFVLLAGSSAMQVVYLCSKILQFGLPVAWVVWVQKRRLQWGRPQAADLVRGLSFGVVAVAVGLAAYYGYFKGSVYLQRAPALIQEKTAGMGLTQPGWYLAFAVFVSLPHSLLEEYYWRWFVFGQSSRVWPVWFAVAVSSLGFMSHHVIVVHEFLKSDLWVTAFFSLCIAFGGAVWALIYRRSGSLYGAWLSHLLLDCGIMWIGYDLIDWSGARG